MLIKWSSDRIYRTGTSKGKASIGWDAGFDRNMISNQWAVAEARSTETPGPIVDDSETLRR